METCQIIIHLQFINFVLLQNKLNVSLQFKYSELTG